MATDPSLQDTGDPKVDIVPKAREAFERGDFYFELYDSATLLRGFTAGKYGLPFVPVQPVDRVNDVCRQGWEVINVTHSQWEVSQSVYMAGFYAFRRCEANRKAA